MPQPLPLRWSAAALAAALLACAGAAPRAAVAQSDQILVVTNTATPALALFYADAQGWFKKAGLNVKIQLVGSGSAAELAVVGNAAQVAFTNPVTLNNAVSKGIPVKALAPGGEYNHKYPTTKLMVLPDSPIKTIPDLDGKTVAVTGLHDLLQVGMEALSDKNGGHASTIHFVEIPASTMWGALQEHRVDAVIDYDPFAAQMVARGARTVCLPLDGVAPEFVGALYMSRTDWLESHRDQAEKFAQVIHDASAYATDHFSELLPFISQYTKLPLDVVKGIEPEVYPPGMYPDLLQPVIDATAKYAGTKAFKASDAVFDIPINRRS